MHLHEVPPDVVQLVEKVPLDVVLPEEMVPPDEVPPLEGVVHLNRVLLNVVQSKLALDKPARDKPAEDKPAEDKPGKRKLQQMEADSPAVNVIYCGSEWTRSGECFAPWKVYCERFHLIH